jgi:hypothetical protein
MRRWRPHDSGSEGQCLFGCRLATQFAYCCPCAELNGLDIMVGDVSSAYLEAFTKEKVCFIAGPEFGELEGHMMTIIKALYGLRTPERDIGSASPRSYVIWDFSRVEAFLTSCKVPSTSSSSKESLSHLTTLAVIFPVIVTAPTHGELRPTSSV